MLTGLWLVAAVTACSILPNLPSIPPGWTLTPSDTLTPEATPSPTITPTPLPVARVEAGDHAFFNGDYAQALVHYQLAYQDSPDPQIRASAKWGEARIFLAQERYADSLTSLQTLLTEYPQSVYFGQAYFLQGLANYRLNNFQAAADSWQTYLSVRPGFLDAYTQELRGDALFNAKNYTDALAAYSAAIQAPSISDDISLDLKVADTQTQLKNYDAAIALYDGLTARAPNDYIKAQVAYETGLVYQTLGRREEALGKFRLAVENYPLSYYAYLSLVALLDADGKVSDLDRGLVDYFAGHYDVAIAAFDRYIAANPGSDGTAYYYRARSRRDSNFFDDAVKDYSTFIKKYPLHPRWGDAWGEKAYIQWYQLNQYSEAAQTLLDYVSAAPGSAIAAGYLLDAARIYERDGQYPKALEIWARVVNEYPGTAESTTAAFLSGIINYRGGDTNSALNSFNTSLSLSTVAEDKARAYLWIGKADKKLGNNDAALAAWRLGQDVDPGGYYSERARDLLAERAPFTPASKLNLIQNLEAERKDADAWVRLTFKLAPETDLSNLGSLASDQHVIRGTELWKLGLLEDAKLEFESLRAELESTKDAVGSYRLTNYLIDLGLYRPAILSARQTLTLAGLNDQSDSMMAPPYFSHIRYGLYYSDLVIANAEANKLDPLFVYSVIRQESLFEGFVKSNAGARGLMQIIPSTGAQINFQLAWPPNYTDKDLYRPDVSVAFGTHYIAKNLSLLSGNLYAALAAYNGGPGNAAIWMGLSGEDPDLFLESVRFDETRNYIRNIYEIHVIYRRLYGTGVQ